MKKLLYFAGVALAWAMTACSAEEIVGLDPNGRPIASDINATITVNQETNQVTFTLDNPGAVPMWAIYKNGTDKEPVRSTRNGYNEIIPLAGTYVVEVKMYNRNGICDGSKLIEFTIDNTIVDWNRYLTPLTGGASKTWEMAHNIKAHLACGPSGTDGTEWWAAGPEEKAGWGLYENRLIFADPSDKGTGRYTFDPGESGTIYVNTGIEDEPFKAYNTNDGADFNYPIAAPIESTFALQMEGNDLFLVLPQATPLIYVPNMDCWSNPKFKVNALTSKMVELTYDNGAIAWHYILQPEGAGDNAGGDTPVDEVQWVDVNSPDNLMNSGALALASTWWADDNWSTIGSPAVDIDGNNAVVTVSEQNGGSQWQGQVHLNTGVAITEGTVYDFKVVLTPSAGISGATVKPHPEGDDGHFFSEGRHDLEAYSDNVVTYTNFVADFSTENLVLTFDFPSASAGTTINIKDIIIQEHSAGGAQSWVDEGSADNLMNGGALALASTWWADNNWSTIGDPTVDVDGNKALITVNEANGGSQWQGQVHLNTGVAITEGNAYDFKIVLTPSVNIAGATVKPHPEGDDGHFFSEARHDLEAYEDNVVVYQGFVADFSTENLVITLDFPSCPAGATIEVKGIIIQEQRVGGGSTGGQSWVDEGSADNLINSGALALASTWWADNNWSTIGDPTVAIDGNKALITVNEANGGSQWQGQVHLNTGVAITEGNAYDFKIVLTPSVNIAGATVKPHPEGDDGHFFSEARHDLEAYEDNVVVYQGFVADFSTENLVITLDFPSCPAGATIEVKGIIIQEHK